MSVQDVGRIWKWTRVHFSFYSVWFRSLTPDVKKNSEKKNSTDVNSVSNFGTKIFPPKTTRYFCLHSKPSVALVWLTDSLSKIKQTNRNFRPIIHNVGTKIIEITLRKQYDSFSTFF